MSEDHQPPNIAEFGKWLGYHLVKDWRMLIKAPIAFFAVLVFSISLAWLFTWQAVVPQKNEQLATMREQNDYLTKKLEGSEKEADQLRSELATARTTPHDEKTFPLKKRALILSSQLKDYAARLIDVVSKNDMVKRNEITNEWENRFRNRVYLVLSQLDEYGQHSEKLETTANQQGIYSPQAADLINLYASEIGRLANNLPDTP